MTLGGLHVSQAVGAGVAAVSPTFVLMTPKVEWYHRAYRAPAHRRRRKEACMAEGAHPEEPGKDDQSPRIKVTDRRHFTLEGERRGDVEEEPEPPTPATTPPASGAARPQANEPKFERRPLDEPEGVDFTMLINAMAQPALLYLGEIPHPASGQATLDLEGARIQIDMLDLLRVKCRGNMTPQEDGLLERVLHQLRMLYVARSGSAG